MPAAPATTALGMAYRFRGGGRVPCAFTFWCAHGPSVWARDPAHIEGPLVVAHIQIDVLRLQNCSALRDWCFLL